MLYKTIEGLPMIRITGIDHMNLYVNDLERSVAFYHDVFGFEEKERGTGRSDQPFIIIGVKGVAYLALHHSDEEMPASGKRINHWGFVVGDLKFVREKLQQQGIPINYDGMIFDWESSQSLYITDPDGHEIELAAVIGGGLD
jgi:lactoylglutathione lyase